MPRKKPRNKFRGCHVPTVEATEDKLCPDTRLLCRRDTGRFSASGFNPWPLHSLTLRICDLKILCRKPGALCRN